MSTRPTLIAGSGIAAWMFATALLWLLDRIIASPGHLSPFSPWGQWFCALPAAMAAIGSAWWHTRRRGGDDLDHNRLAARICGWSFPLFGLLNAFAVALADPPTLRGLSDGLPFLRELATLTVMVSISGLIFLFPFAFMLEYIVVRLIRARWPRAVFSGAAP